MFTLSDELLPRTRVEALALDGSRQAHITTAAATQIIVTLKYSL